MFETILGIKKPTFGLDIGRDTLKIVQVKGALTRAQLVSAVEVPIPKNSLTKEGIKQKEQLAEIIRHAAASALPHAANAKIVASALPESLVFTKNLNLPKMAPADIEKNIPFQAKDFLPIPPENTYLDWQVVAELPNNTLEVLVVASPKTLVDSLIETVKLAGLDLLGLETKPVALTRALILPKDPGPYLVLDIGAQSCGLTCYDRGTIKLTSTVTYGGDQIKKDPDILKALAGEIIHLAKYYNNRIGSTEIFKKVLLAGGGASIENVEKTLEKFCKIETQIGQPIIKLKNYHPKFASALGLALKEI